MNPMRPAQSTTRHRMDGERFLIQSQRWTLIRLYVMTFAIPCLTCAGLFGWFVAVDVSRPVEQVSASATESSRPLEGEDKAPADWTGDGIADGWLPGVWLPGQSGTVYLVEGEQVPTPTGLAGYIMFGAITFLTAAGAFGIAGFLLSEWFDRVAFRAARRDWSAAMTEAENHPLWRNGIPI